EESRRAEAERDYRTGSYRTAAQKYRELADRSKGARADQYHFLADLADVREAAARTPPEPAEALQLATPFVQKYAREPLLAEYRDDLGLALAHVADDLAAAAEAALASPADLDKLPEIVARGEEAVGLVERFPTKGNAEALAAKFAGYKLAHAEAVRRRGH